MIVAPFHDKILAITMFLVITSYEKNVLLDFDSIINSTELKFWIERFVPNVKISDVKTTKIEFKIHCIDSIEGPNIKRGNTNEVYLFNNWSQSSFGYLGKFISQIFQMILIEEGIYFFPGACVSHYNKAILFVGDYWQGKTSVVMGMMKDAKNLLISDNVVGFDGNKIIGGTKYVSCRKENKHVSFDKPEKMKVFEVNGRSYFNLEDYSNEAKQPLELVGIINAHINKGDHNIHKVPKEEALWYLNSKFSALIKGEVLLFDGKIPSPSLDTESNSLKRLNLVRNILTKLDLIYLSAPLEEIVDYSNKLLIA